MGGEYRATCSAFGYKGKQLDSEWNFFAYLESELSPSLPA
jgi:hypothetical protein